MSIAHQLPGNLLILLYLMQDGGSLPHRDEAFDSSTFLDALEHVTHPQENPKKEIRSLHNGGFVLLTTDDFDYLIATIAGLTYRMRCDRIRYPMEWAFIRHNCCYFVETIPRLFLSRDREIRNMLGHRGFPLGVCLIATIEAQVHGAYLVGKDTTLVAKTSTRMVGSRRGKITATTLTATRISSATTGTWWS
jgi:hypothetical protein